MWEVIGIIMVSVAIAAFEIKAMGKQKKGMERMIFLTLLSIVCVLMIAQSLHFVLPNPLVWIEALFKPVGIAIRSW